MCLDLLINIIHTLLVIFILLSPFIKDCFYKMYSYTFIGFILFHYFTKYGKCGIINIERFFIGTNFKKGFFYRLIKPVIGHKNNTFCDNCKELLLVYFIILSIQLYKKKCLNRIDFTLIKKMFKSD